jgi:membrane protein
VQAETRSHGLGHGRGHRASGVGWKETAKSVAKSVDRDNVPLMAGGLAFFGLLAGPPLLLALVSIYGLVSDPAAVESQLQSLSEVLPEQARELVGGQLAQITSMSPQGLGFGVALSIAAALYASSKGTFYLIRALNNAFGEEESRGIVRLKLTALGFTLGFIIAASVAIAAIAVLPVVLGFVGLGGVTETLLNVGRWPVLALFLMLGLSVLYRYAPNRKTNGWKWFTPGSAFATVGWLAASFLFSLYVSRFGSFNETYGSLGTIVVLMMWLFLSAFVILVGALLDAHLEGKKAPGGDAQREEPRRFRTKAVE